MYAVTDRTYARSQMGHHVYNWSLVVPGWMTITVRCLSDRQKIIEKSGLNA